MNIGNAVGVTIGLIIIYFAAFALFGEKKTLPEQIEAECRRSYGNQGEQAVANCQLAMSVRYLNEADRERADTTYNRIR